MAKIESVNSPPKNSDGNDPNQEREKSVESPASISVQQESNPNNENSIASISVQGDSNASLPGEEGGLGTENNVEVVQVGRSLEEKADKPVIDEHFTSSPKAEEQTGSVAKSEEHSDAAAEVAKSEEHADTAAEVAKIEEHADKVAEIAKSEGHADTAAENEESTKSPMREEFKESSNN